MENASKALIVAGAIFLSILIISLGIYIFNQASEVTKSSNLSEIEVLQFNEKYTSYEGENVRGSEVNTLLTRIVQNNVGNQDDKSKQVNVTVQVNDANWQSGTKPSGAITSLSSKALTGKTYRVSCDLDEKTGLVSNITIAD
ncbi:MAG: hypothetical protein HFJ35_05660 [Clostridia bacterium]|nr:hypothetical protein [Clostridia bacterium]